MEIIESTLPQIIDKDVYETEDVDVFSEIIYDARKIKGDENINIEFNSPKPIEAYQNLSKINNNQQEKSYREKITKKSNPNLEQKYHKISSELEEFAKELETIHNESPNYLIDQEFTVEEILMEVKKLQSNLAEDYSKLPSLSNTHTSSAELENKMNTLLHSKEGEKSISNDITYQLYRVPNHSISSDLKLVDIESRISSLEKCVGVDKTGASPIVIGATIELLELKLQYLRNPKNLEKILSQIKEITNLLLSNKLISRSKGANESISTINKIDKLFEILDHWEAFTTELPLIVERLQKLKLISESAEESIVFYQEMSNESVQITEKLKEDGNLLQQVERKNIEAVEKIAASISSLEEKFSEVERKLEGIVSSK